MKKIKSILVLIIILIIAFSTKTYAAEGSFSLSKTSVTLTEGSNTTFSIKATNCEGKFTITSSNSNVVKVSSSSVWVTGSESITLTAVKKGTAKITITASDVGDTDENTVSGSKTISVTVKEKTTTSSNTGNTGNNNNNNSGSSTTTKKSNNANLKTLGVTPKEYDFSGFSKSKTSYSVTVPNNVDSLKVVYKAEDSKASVKVSGDSGFETGSNNQIKVVVTAEDGTTKTYTIKVTKLAEDEEKPGNIIDDDKNDGLYLTSLTIKGIELSPKFAKDTFSYTATLKDSSVNELEVEAKANNEKANIAISGNTNLEDGENTINIILTVDDSSEQTIYQVVVNKEAAALPATTSSEITPTSNNDFMGSIKTYIGIVIAIIVLVVVAVIVLIILLRRENKRLKEEDMDDEEYNVYKNDANEFKNKNENFIASLKDENTYEEELSEEDKETLEEINKQTKEIFKEKVQGQSIEYGAEELEERKNRKDKGRHF